MMRRIFTGGIFTLFILLLSSLAFGASFQPLVRIKDLTDIQGVRENQLVGMGLVVGLPGTGDKGNMALQMMQNMARQYCLGVDLKSIKSKNAAVVTVTAQLPPFVRPGQTVDVSVAAMGDAKSLQGGTLLQTPLRAANGNVYAVAQGPLLVGGYEVGGEAGAVAKNITTAGIVPGGGIVERDVPVVLGRGGHVVFQLKNPDFTTAQRVADTINTLYFNSANPLDAGRVEVRLPQGMGGNPSRFIAELENLEIRPDAVARVVVNERTGTVVMGADVRVSTVAVAHGNLTVRIEENPEASQPDPFSMGETAILPRTDVEVTEDSGQLLEIPTNTTVEELVEALNGVGASPRDVISILQAIDRAGALYGELVIQ